MSWLKEMVGQLSLEFPVRNKRISDLALQLETSGKEIIERLTLVQNDLNKDQAKMRHIIGIERWGQRRLRGFLGDEPSNEEYNSYCPEGDYRLQELVELFREARAKTVYLAIQLEALFVSEAKVAGKLNDKRTENGIMSSDSNNLASNNKLTSAIKHNEFGPLTPRGWLRYLEMHARMESKSIK